jgi:glyoxylase-like metal-dependent hydrolase (beta-lactamase superfamily II)
MTLEDHIGDIAHKARRAAGVSLEAAAQAAGLSPQNFEQWERAGQGARPNLASLAGLLKLDAAKLEGIAAGWTPSEPDLGRWRELRVIRTTREGNTVNCFLVWDEATREAALFDTGWDAAPVLALVAEHGLALRHLFLTHLHEDHVAGMGALRTAFPGLRLHTNSPTVPPQHRNRANECVSLGSLRVTHRDTPGHAAEGVTYLVGNWPEDAPHVAVVGDTLFAGSLATGFESEALLRESVRTQILSLPLETLLCPGHGPLTTVALERAHNPFFP